MSITLAAYARVRAALALKPDDYVNAANAALFAEQSPPGYSASEIWYSGKEKRHSGEYHIAFFVQLFVIMFVLDKLVLQALLRRTHETTRWYYLHFLGNMILCAYAVPSYFGFFRDPVGNLVSSPAPFFFECTWCVAVVHLYHLLAFKCKGEDWVHHILFVGGGVSTAYAALGQQADIYLSFVSGFPGGIDYLLLALVKEGLVDKKTRLRIALELNIWVRSPGILFAYSMCCIWMLYRPVYDYKVIYAFLMVTIAAPVNAQFYARQVAMAAGAQLNKDGEPTPSMSPPMSPSSSPSGHVGLVPPSEQAQADDAEAATTGGDGALPALQLPAKLLKKGNNNNGTASASNGGTTASKKKQQQQSQQN